MGDAPKFTKQNVKANALVDTEPVLRHSYLVSRDRVLFGQIIVGDPLTVAEYDNPEHLREGVAHGLNDWIAAEGYEAALEEMGKGTLQVNLPRPSEIE